MFVQDSREERRGDNVAGAPEERSPDLAPQHPSRLAQVMLSQPLGWAPFLLRLFRLCTNCGDGPEGGPTVRDSLLADESYKAGNRLIRRAGFEKIKEDNEKSVNFFSILP